MIGQANVTHIVVGKDDDLATSSETRADLIAGQIGVFLVGSTTAIGTGATDLAAGDKFTIVYKRVDGALIETPVIEYSKITNKSAVTTPVAATQRVRAVGFNGVSGSIDVANNEDYVVHYEWDDGKKVFGNGKPVKFLAYRSSGSATQVEIAAGLAANAAANVKFEKYPIVIGKVLINNAGAAITGTGTLTAAKGSKLVTAGTDVDAVVAVGDYIRLGTVAGAAVTDDAYRVVELDTTNEVITLDRVFQGTSATYVEANCDYIAGATAASAAAGFQLVGQVQPFEPGIKTYLHPVEFKFWKLGEGLGSSTISTTSVPDKGVGTYKEIAEHEWFLRGNRGNAWRVGNYPKTITLDATEGKTYSQITFNYVDSSARTIDRTVDSFGTVFIATEVDSAGGAHASLIDILNIS